MDKIILHIDFDSFFASVEQQNNPLFRGIPIGVTATNGRTCIIAASREAKKFGIKTGSRSFDAFRVCPKLKLVPANFVNYWEVSKKFIAICKDFSPLLEVFSIDELFLDVTATVHLFGGVDGLITKLKQRIAKEIGEYITVSIGVSHNKLLAKLASGLQKPNGVVFITPETVLDVYAKAELLDICGIGPRVALHLNKIGIYTLMNLSNTPLVALLQEFGDVGGRFLYNVGQGIDDSPVLSYTISPSVKSVGRNYCLPQNEYRKRVVLQNIYELCEEIAIKLRRLEKKTKRVGINLSGNINFHGFHTMDTYTHFGQDIYAICRYIVGLDFMQESSDYVRQIGITTTSLQDSIFVQESLFGAPLKQEAITKTIDKLNDRFGDHTIRNGFLLYAQKLTTVPNGYGSDMLERAKLARISSE